MEKIIEVTVSAQGETTVETKGFRGPECMRASEALEQALGMAIATSKTAEYHQSEQARQTLTRSN